MALASLCVPGPGTINAKLGWRPEKNCPRDFLVPQRAGVAGTTPITTHLSRIMGPRRVKPLSIHNTEYSTKYTSVASETEFQP